MNFTYQLDSAGWAWMDIEINGVKHYSTPSFLSDPLSDIARGLCDMVYDLYYENGYRLEFMVSVHHEPLVEKWVFNRKEDDLFIAISDDKNEKVSFLEFVNIDEFIRKFLLALDALLLKYGFVGYQSNWINFNFPISEYLKLKDYLSGFKLLKKEEVIGEYGTEVEVSDFSREIEVLHNLLGKRNRVN